MEYTTLGTTGLHVSRVCLGTMNFGPQTTAQESHAIMDRALDAGINFFDTADFYGGADASGRTEEIVGNWIAEGPSHRDDIVLATKVYSPLTLPGRRPNPNRDRPGLSALKMIRACEASLKRLKTDRIDLFQLHHIDRSCPVDEVLQAFETLRRQGKILYAGSSNFAGWDIATYVTEARFRQLPRLVCEQSVYNLTNRAIELEVLPACQAHGMGLIAWSPLGGGALAGKSMQAGRREGEKATRLVARYREQIEGYEAFCAELGATPAAVGLAWVLAQPGVTAPIVGPRTLQHLDDAVATPDLELSPEALNHLDNLFPGPGGSAPEAYAW